MKILIADDDAMTRVALRKNLKKWGYEVVEARDGAEAWKVFAEDDPPRLAILDWMMPEVEGIEICGRLGGNKDFPFVYTILLTSKTDKDDIVKALDSGAYDFLSKPVHAGELRSRIAVGARLVEAEDRLLENAREIQKARESAESANIKIMDSIRYANMIQRSLLPNLDELKKSFPNSFFIWMPKDIVGGDIIYTDSFENGFVFAVIDCTGHGVPGAFMTMIASSAMRRITRDERCHQPNEILKRLNFIVKTSLQQDTEYALSDDGMDAAICFVNSEKSSLTFAGSRLPLYCTHNGDITLIKGDRHSIGYKRSDLNFNFTNHSVRIEKGMSFYVATDGFPDQLGGKKNISFGKRRLQKLLIENTKLPFDKQPDILIEAFNAYKKDNERQDDLTVIGFGF
ncbi:response regulator [Desulfobacterales bacterium HSG16]|nr:response regulator [Desulfobacterales bacterium HSG16]